MSSVPVSPVQIGIQAGTDLLKVGLALLAQHTARLKNAQSENAAIVTVIDPFDSDVAEMVDAFNSGIASAFEVSQASYNVNANIYSYMRSLQGRPGTAWDSGIGMAGKCNKQCTAACCVYYGDLGPVLSMINVAMGGPGWGWGKSDPRYHSTAGGVSIDVPEVFGSKFGGRDRPAYSITLTTPTAVQGVKSTLEKTINGLSGSTGALSNLGVPAESSSIPSVSGNPLFLVGGLFLIVLLGSSLVRK